MSSLLTPRDFESYPCDICGVLGFWPKGKFIKTVCDPRRDYGRGTRRKLGFLDCALDTKCLEEYGKELFTEDEIDWYLIPLQKKWIKRRRNRTTPWKVAIRPLQIKMKEMLNSPHNKRGKAFIESQISWAFE